MQWKWITWTGKQITITQTGPQKIRLDFDGKQITRAAQDGWSGGRLVAWLTIRNSTTWTEISRLNEYKTIHSYSPHNFTASPITFNGTIIDSGGPETTPYTYLKVIVPLKINSSSATSNYIIYGSLFDTINKTFIISNSTAINKTLNNVTVYFNGSKIRNKHYNGTYEFKAIIFDTIHKYECDRMANTTQYYTYDEFNLIAPEAIIYGNYNNITHGKYLVINATIHVNSPGRYELYGDLFDNTSSTFITNARNQSNLSTSNYNVTLEFNRSAINSTVNSTGISAPYKLAYLRLSIYNTDEQVWEELDVKINPYYTHGGA
jgi:hypothetical protein